MAAEYRLSHTASEIDRKLSEIDNLGKVKSVNGITPDGNGNVVIEIPEVEIPEINYPVTSVNGQTGDVSIDIPSTEGLATEEYVNNAIGGIEIPSVEGLATEEYVNNAIESVGGNTGDFKGIIDVAELPTDNIRENAMYRLMTAKIISNKYDYTDNGFIAHCVNELPEVGEVVTDSEMSYMIAYYNISDGDVYGYLDDTLATSFGITAGWYPFGMLAEVSGSSWNGVITDISDDPCDSGVRVLLSYDYYVYKNEWTKLLFAYEKPPKFDITWDGNMTDRTVIDMSLLGYDAGTYFVKVSDEILNTNDVIGGTYEYKWDEDSSSSESEIYESSIDTVQFPGAFTINSWIVIIQDEDALATALGVPSGFITNGVYYLLVENTNRVIRLTTPKRVTKIDGEYVDTDSMGLSEIAFSGSWYDLNYRPTIYTDVIQYNTTQSLSSTQKTRARTNIDVYSRSEVDTKIGNVSVNVDLSDYAKTSDVQALIDTAIGTAIGGSY